MKKLKLFFTLFSIYLFALVSGCKQHNNADAIYFNGKIYTVDSIFSVKSVMVVKDGKVVATGDQQLLSEYTTQNQIDLKGRFVYPGFQDAHCHFYGYGTDLVKIWLTGTQSFNDILDTLEKYKNKTIGGWIVGRGWDQNDWEDQTYPDKTALDSLFPDTPVFLMRIDGHAILVNQKVLDIAGITAETKITGGEILKNNGKLTGILIDNAADIVKDLLPEPSHEEAVTALLQAQNDCLPLGLTHLTDAGIHSSGLSLEIIKLIDSLQQNGNLAIRMNIMARVDEIPQYLSQPYKKTERLSVTGFKMYADGALGSRGACLKQPYNDKPGHYGFQLVPVNDLDSIAALIANSNYQLNTHCIGDSAQKMMLSLYAKHLSKNNDRRWRIEHAQVIDPADLHYYKEFGIIPSVQPVHATSDMYWAEDRIGAERIKGAYAYNTLLQTRGMIAAGSDFPVEYLNPLYGFYAAVARKDREAFPEGGWHKEEAISREDALRAMTIWAAYACFDENKTGSLEPGKFADFVIMDRDLLHAPEDSLWQLKVQEVYINGENKYTRKNQ